jgi:hypothetical protein
VELAGDGSWRAAIGGRTFSVAVMMVQLADDLGMADDKWCDEDFATAIGMPALRRQALQS